MAGDLGRSVSRDPWPHESCFDCLLRMPDDRSADVHYAMTGHQMGWPLDVDEMSWPVASETQVTPPPTPWGVRNGEW